MRYIHINCKGECKKCADILRGENRKYTKEEIIQKAKEIHKNKYDYSKVVYNGIYDKIIIICKEHGEFLQTPSGHIRGTGCQKCYDERRSSESRFTKEEIIQKFSKSSEYIEVIAHGNSLPNGVFNKPSKPYFLSIGTVEPRKNLDFYSKAIEISKLNSDFDFIHVGRIGWGKLPSNLKRIDVNSDQDLANLIVNSSAVVITSTYEGFGLPVLEAHVQGAPVIMSNVKSLMELSNNQDKIFDLANIDSLVDALVQFSTNSTKLDLKYIENAQNFTWLKSAQRHVETYLRLLND